MATALATLPGNVVIGNQFTGNGLGGVALSTPT